MEPLEEVKIYPFPDACVAPPDFIGIIKLEDVRAIQRNTVRMGRWGLLNQSTLEYINKEALEELKKPEN